MKPKWYVHCWVATSHAGALHHNFLAFYAWTVLNTRWLIVTLQQGARALCSCQNQQSKQAFHSTKKEVKYIPLIITMGLWLSTKKTLSTFHWSAGYGMALQSLVIDHFFPCHPVACHPNTYFWARDAPESGAGKAAEYVVHKDGLPISEVGAGCPLWSVNHSVPSILIP